MVNMPKVSICIPTYNQSQYLAECLNSALGQSMSNIEVVVSVNHCTDDTGAILQRYTDPRLRIVTPPQFLPMFEHFNFCISQSKGKYFSFLCSDDVLMPEFAEQQSKIMDVNPGVVFAHAAAEIIDASGKRVSLNKPVSKSFIRPGTRELRRYIYGSRCVGDSTLVRRSAFEKAGGFSSCSIVGDWDLWLRLLQTGDVAYNAQVLLKYRVWNDRAGHRKARRITQLKETVELYQKHEPALTQKYPGLAGVFKAARRRQALSSISGLTGIDEENRNQARKYILALSSSRQVKLKLALYDLGLGPLWNGAGRFKAWLKSRVKSLLYLGLPSK